MSVECTETDRRDHHCQDVFQLPCNQCHAVLAPLHRSLALHSW